MLEYFLLVFGEKFKKNRQPNIKLCYEIYFYGRNFVCLEYFINNYVYWKQWNHIIKVKTMFVWKKK